METTGRLGEEKPPEQNRIPWQGKSGAFFLPKDKLVQRKPRYYFTRERRGFSILPGILPRFAMGTPSISFMSRVMSMGFAWEM